MFKKILIAKQIALLPKVAKPINTPYKFLQQSLLSGIQFYNDEFGLEYISFFNEIYFVLSNGENKSKATENLHLNQNQWSSLNNQFVFYQAKNDSTDNEISQTLRKSSTLVVNHNNTFESLDVKAVFSEGSAWIFSKIGSKQFERFSFLYLLAQAYNLYSQKQLELVDQAYTSNKLENMRVLKENILAFNVSFYFSNPVIINRHQARSVWKIIANLLDVQQVHTEVKNQIKDLSDVIQNKLQIKQDARYKRYEVSFWIIGALIGLTTLISNQAIEVVVSSAVHDIVDKDDEIVEEQFKLDSK